MTDIRCFVAVDLPAQMREEIGRLESQIETEGLRLVRPELVHVTLKFLGDVPEEKVQRVADALSGVRIAPFAAKVRGIGTFPARSIRIVWLGLDGDFQGLYAQVEKSLRPFEFKREARGFSPHVTLGRVGRPSVEINRKLAPKIAALSGADLGGFVVDRFYLKKSTLTRGGPIYDDLAEFPLRD